MAALSESARIGMCAVSSHAATTAPGSPSRSAPTTSVSPSPSSCARLRPLRATSATVGRGSSSTRATRTTGTQKIAPIDARTALKPYGSAVPGPSATLAAPNASAERSTAPTLPGSPTPHSATHTGPTAAGAQRCG
jgi:hypothetical protein